MCRLFVLGAQCGGASHEGSSSSLECDEKGSSHGAEVSFESRRIIERASLSWWVTAFPSHGTCVLDSRKSGRSCMREVSMFARRDGS
eukprot:CAMPEP_0184381288 /NCGR_PEP_ID=MMETSP0007-20130409/5403_1 /TAXON_ID=97485 /ORGANISM="Prymnesium parvum, Strain Texoma1" /LENGTH=86 /DNA_ID=CAMNT_0026726841 /DNA_START=655 /DNA_END=911 /DNA_ORIENTATION=+